MTLGGNVIVRRYEGMKREEDIKTTIGTNLTIFFIVGIILTVVMLVFVDNILTLLQTPKSAFDEAKEYVSVCACGIIFICGYNAISAILRGYGDSKSPLVFVFISSSLFIPAYLPTITVPPNVKPDIILVIICVT